MEDSMYDMIKQGLDEAIEFEQGKRTLKSHDVLIPSEPNTYTSKDIKALRKKLDCSQPVLAAMLAVSPKTVQAWEAGSRHPNGTASRLMDLIGSKKNLEAFVQAVNTFHGRSL